MTVYTPASFTTTATLSAQDLQRWSLALEHLPGPEQFINWMGTRVRDFFPFERVLLVHGELLAGRLQATHWTGLGHCPQYLAQFAHSFSLDQRSSLAWWLRQRQPLLLDQNTPPPFTSPYELAEMHSFNLRTIAAHGVVSLRGTAGTYFSFSGMPAPLGPWHAAALRLISPVLHDLMLQTIVQRAGSCVPALTELTERERDIARLVCQGLEDKAIAVQLGITEKTVRNRLTAIYAQLGLQGRIQLANYLR